MEEKKVVDPEKRVKEELSIAEEVLANTNVEENLKFNFDFKKYFPAKGIVVYKDVENPKGGGISLIGISGDSQGSMNEPYYEMQDALKMYYQDAVFRSNLLGKLQMERDLLRWIKKTRMLTGRQVKELKKEMKRICHGKKVKPDRRDVFPIIKNKLEENWQETGRKPSIAQVCQLLIRNWEVAEAFEKNVKQLKRFCYREIKNGRISPRK